MRQVEERLALPRAFVGRRRGAMRDDAAAKHAEPDAFVREADARIGPRGAKLRQHRLESRGGRRAQPVALQEMAQHVPRAMRRERGEAGAIERARRPATGAASSAARSSIKRAASAWCAAARASVAG